MDLFSILSLLLIVALVVGIGYYSYKKNQNFEKKYFNDYKYSYDKDDLKINILFGKNGIMNITSSLSELNDTKFSYYIGDTQTTPSLKNVIFINDRAVISVNDNISFWGINATKKEDITNPLPKPGLSLVNSKIGNATKENPLIIPIIDSSLIINCKSESLINYDTGICDYA
jgi:hypothetical protein